MEVHRGGQKKLSKGKRIKRSVGGCKHIGTRWKEKRKEKRAKRAE